MLIESLQQLPAEKSNETINIAALQSDSMEFDDDDSEKLFSRNDAIRDRSSFNLVDNVIIEAADDTFVHDLTD